MLALLVAIGGVLAGVAAALTAGGRSTPPVAARRGLTNHAGRGAHARSPGGDPRGRARPKPQGPFAVGAIVLRVLDNTRSIRLPGGRTVPRTLKTYIRYPALGPATNGDLPNASPARTGGPFPLIVFGHGFAVTPTPYVRLLRAWAQAGYVVAAPVFPLANAQAPGGPDESDLPNQPADMRAVISNVLAGGNASSGPLSGLLDGHRIAVAGQSDGGDSALALAYDPRVRDPRVGAAMILSGAEIPGTPGFQIAPGEPPLLATQGTADTINPPNLTHAFYDTAPAPKFLLELPGAPHLAPYSSQEPQLGIVERVTIAFLDHYLKRTRGSLQRLLGAGSVPGVATLNANP